jgi:alcohol dehydrogenase (cytochrome c)
MIKRLSLISSIAAATAFAQVQGFTPVTQQMLENPSPDDWLMFSRTYDAQRYSPLKQITKQNVGQLRMVWTRGIGAGQTETIPLVHKGVMYVVAPGAIVQAFDGATGDLLWEYKRKVPANIAGSARTKSLAIYQDIILYTAPDSFVVGLDARTGEQRWETKTDARGHTSGPIVVEGKVITGAACAGKRENCYIAAHDALTGKEAWRFYTTPGIGEPGDES